MKKTIVKVAAITGTAVITAFITKRVIEQKRLGSQVDNFIQSNPNIFS